MAYKIPFSQQTVRNARQYSVTPEELAFVDLVACGWHKRDAYIITHNAHTLSDEAIERNAREILARPLCKDRLSEIKGKSRVVGSDGTDLGDVDISDALSKENTLKDLYIARNKAKVGTKEWLDVVKLIADITRMKQEEVQNEDTTVHFYLPLTCSRCRLYKDHKAKGNM